MNQLTVDGAQHRSTCGMRRGNKKHWDKTKDAATQTVRGHEVFLFTMSGQTHGPGGSCLTLHRRAAVRPCPTKHSRCMGSSPLFWAHLLSDFSASSLPALHAGTGRNVPHSLTYHLSGGGQYPQRPAAFP